MQAKKNGRAVANAAGRLMLVVGTAAGNVRAFSAATAKELWAANGCNEGCAKQCPITTCTIMCTCSTCMRAFNLHIMNSLPPICRCTVCVLRSESDI